MASNTIPFDDLELEMEDMEGLIELSTIGNGRRNRSSQSNSFVVGAVAGMCNSQYRGRWTCLILVVAAVLMALLMIGAEDIQTSEGAGGSHVSDVEDKAPVEITLSPTLTPKTDSPPPTQLPATLPPTNLPKTSPPTVAPIAKTPDAKKSASQPEDGKPENQVQDTPPTEAVAVKNPEAKPDDGAETVPINGFAWPQTPFAVRTENAPPQAVMDEYAKTWGTWQLGELPEMDRDAFCGDRSHCDVPRDNFPSNAWQADSAFVPKFLDEADKLVDRAMHAILAEYGKSADDTAMFDLTYKDLKRRELRSTPPPNNAGWTTKRSMQGLSRRLLHAIMTRDTFTFVMGGHSAAAGHGNHFKQSYTMQFHKIMEPVFSYLGVQLISRNLAQGGLGTIQSALGSADIYGDEIDFMVWDSGMTEGGDEKAVDMFGRQALMGNRVPVLWNLSPNLLEMYHEHCDADVGLHGTGEVGIVITKDEAHADELPYASQYYLCDEEHGEMCRDYKYSANCWVDRPDVTPPTKQGAKPGGQASWHPGFRWHQLTGRVLAYTVLSGLKEAIGTWQRAERKVLPDDAWHITAYYDNIRNKVMDLNTTLGACNQYEGMLPLRMCNTQMRGRTEFTPRANPEKTSIRSILKSSDYVPTVKGDILYDGPDVRNPMFDIPNGQVDVLAILNNGRTFPDNKRSRQLSVESPIERRASDVIVPGKGYELVNHPVGYCDGSYNAICSRSAATDCLLYAHHDARGGLVFHEYSGWIVMEVPKVRHGIIVIKMETWHFADEMTVAKDWTTVNNERNLRNRDKVADGPHNGDEGGWENRNLKRAQIPYCDDFRFDFAVDGKITTYNAAEFQQADNAVQRVVECFTMLDDPNYVKAGEEKGVELAIRMRGCGNRKVFLLTHVYWA